MPSGTSASDKNRRSRITAACAVCRGKRQKCSGSKPQCDQCRTHNEECWWIDQKKRGPAKDYLRSLQDRLQETERLLLGILPQVPDEVLGEVLQQHEGSNGPSHQTWTSSLSGPDYWSRFHLNRLDHIREWQDHRADGAPRPSPQSSQPAPRASPSASQGRPRNSITSLGPGMMNEHTGPPDSHPRQHPTSGEWQQSKTATPQLDERRYSEETRDACEVLFSISNPNSRLPDTKPANYAPPEHTSHPYPATADWTVLPSQFPKHLFW